MDGSLVGVGSHSPYSSTTKKVTCFELFSTQGGVPPTHWQWTRCTVDFGRHSIYMHYYGHACKTNPYWLSLSLSLSLFPQPTSPSIGVHPFSAFIPGVHNMVACKWKPPRTLWNKADQQQGKIANVPYGKVIDMNSKGVRTLNCHLTHSHWLAL